MGRHTKDEKKQRKWPKVLAFLLLSALVVIVFAVSYLFGIDGWIDFDPAKVKEGLSVSLTIKDGGGKEYAVLSDGELRRYITVKELPAHVKNAFIAIEDARFYEHNGIDAVRIAGALFEDMKSGAVREGASTISQQLVKNTLLTSGQTVSRKMAEIMMAFKLEKAYSKDEILELYLNTVYFGDGAYGIDTAAHTYFGKSAVDLTVSEAATLAGILKAPNIYSPKKNYEKSMARRSLVVEAMKKCGFITEAEEQEAKREKITLTKKDDGYPFGYYTDRVQAEAKSCLGVTQAELLSGGYTIYTNLDESIQSKAEKLCLDDSLFPGDAADGAKCQCAVVVIDAKKGTVASLVGGRTHTAMLALNRATSMRRQPGSAIKPIMVFAPAIEYGGYTTTSMILDEPADFNGYTPRNSGSAYKGWVTLRDTAAYSINIPAVKILEDVGISRAKAYAESVGIEFSEHDNNLSLALGGFTTGVTPAELASSYLPFADGGTYCSPSCIEKICDRYANVVYRAPREKYSVLSPETAFLVTSVLESSAEYGTSKELRKCGIELAAKTGTSTYDDAVNNKDAWIVAYNPEYIVCVWMGFDNTDDAHSLPRGVTGGTYPAKFAARLFEELYKDTSKAPGFTVPGDIDEVTIDAKKLKEDTVLSLATTATEPSDARSEYYKEGTMPEFAEELYCELSASSLGDAVRLTFRCTKGAVYTLKRGGETLYTGAGDDATATVDDNSRGGIYTLTAERGGERKEKTVIFGRQE